MAAGSAYLFHLDADARIYVRDGVGHLLSPSPTLAAPFTQCAQKIQAETCLRTLEPGRYEIRAHSPMSLHIEAPPKTSRHGLCRVALAQLISAARSLSQRIRNPRTPERLANKPN
jgi:hypothetical protein